MISSHVILTSLFGLCLATNAHALGFELGESKEELKLDYQITVADHKTGRVTIVFTLKDEGRLKPLNSVDLSVPSKDGSGKFHLVTSLKLRERDGSKVARVHIHKDWAKNARIDLKTSHLDGKLEPATWYYHSIRVGKLIAEDK